jgi:high-affinity Fe2+/Pb2+ permease
MVFIPLLFIPIFLAWILYRLLIKKDLMKHREELSFGLVFIIIWVIIYIWLTQV